MMNTAYEKLKEDAVMRGLIQKYGELTLSKSNAYFADLASAIVAQQLSGKAADTIYKRVLALADGEVSPQAVLSLPDESLRQAGVSQSKVGYIKNLARAVTDGNLNLVSLDALTDEEIIRLLTAVKGIGRWTAEMFLIFSLAREDVFSMGDGGLNSAFIRLYGSGAPLNKAQIQVITDRWKPYRSIASLYLWRSLDNK